MGFHRLFFVILGNIRGSIKRELVRFFTVSGNGLKSVSTPAFCQARLKIDPAAFQEASRRVLDLYYRQGFAQRFEGYRLLAIDGSTLRLRGVSPACARFYASQSGWDEEDPTTPLARVSICYDILNKVCLDSIIAPFSVGEHALAASHLHGCAPGDLLLIDRNYPCFWMLRNMQDRGLSYCGRIKIRQWKKLLGDFLYSQENDRTVPWTPDRRQKGQCQELGIDPKPMQVRLVRLVLPDGEIEVLITNLTQEQGWTVEKLSQLYCKRWGAEEQYKLSKRRSELERWSGKSQLAVEQDFYGRILLENLASLFSSKARKIIKRMSRRCRLDRQINRTGALSHTRNYLFELFFSHNLISLFRELRRLYLEDSCVIRANRTSPRVFRRPPADFAFAYKPIA